jgi:(2Fe-2S) ferredoxin
MKNLNKIKRHLILCNGEKCTSLGSNEMILAIREQIKKCRLHDQVHTTRSLCNGRCNDGPIVIVYPDFVWYKKVDATVADKIVKTHLVKNEHVIDNLLYNK